MIYFLRTHPTFPALALTASALGIRAPVAEQVEAVQATVISINQFAPQNSALFRREI
jgi:hypothetical protein